MESPWRLKVYLWQLLCKKFILWYLYKLNYGFITPKKKVGTVSPLGSETQVLSFSLSWVTRSFTFTTLNLPRSQTVVFTSKLAQWITVPTSIITTEEPRHLQTSVFNFLTDLMYFVLDLKCVNIKFDPGFKKSKTTTKDIVLRLQGKLDCLK